MACTSPHHHAVANVRHQSVLYRELCYLPTPHSACRTRLQNRCSGNMTAGATRAGAQLDAYTRHPVATSQQGHRCLQPQHCACWQPCHIICSRCSISAGCTRAFSATMPGLAACCLVLPTMLPHFTYRWLALVNDMSATRQTCSCTVCCVLCSQAGEGKHRHRAT